MNQSESLNSAVGAALQGDLKAAFLCARDL